MFTNYTRKELKLKELTGKLIELKESAAKDNLLLVDIQKKLSTLLFSSEALDNREDISEKLDINQMRIVTTFKK